MNIYLKKLKTTEKLDDRWFDGVFFLPTPFEIILFDNLRNLLKIKHWKSQMFGK